MANVVISGDTSGAITLAAPAVAGTTTLTLPATTGTLVVTSGAQTIEFADGTVSAPSITNSGDTNTGIFFPAADTIAFTEGGVESMRINSSGNVGIGTSSPEEKLTLNGTYRTATSQSWMFEINNTATQATGYGGGIAFGGKYDASDITYFANITGAKENSSSGDVAGYLAFFSRGSGDGNTTERMRITSGGQLVVGSTTALGQATIYKNASGLQSSSPQLTLQNAVVDGASGDGPGINFANATGAIANIGSAGNGIMFFSNRATSGAGWSERMRIDSSGNVGIGTNSPSVRLQVAGSSIFQDSMQIFNNPTASAQGILFRNTFNVGGSIFSMGAATTNDIILWVGGSGTQGAITGNGAGINYSSNSDYRLKENVAPMTGALAKVSQLKPCTYIWKFDGSEGQGFIAHELQEVFPDAVTGKKDDVETYTDEDGNEQTKIKPQGVDTSFLVATLTAALQELKAIVDTQATKIAELEAKLEGTA